MCPSCAKIITSMYFNILVQTKPRQRWTVRQQVLVHFQVTKVLRNGHTSALSTGMITKSSWVSVETIPFYGSKALTTGYKWICSPYKRPYKWVITSTSRVGFWAHLEPFFNMFFSKHFLHQRKKLPQHLNIPAIQLCTQKPNPSRFHLGRLGSSKRTEGARIGGGLGRIFPLLNVPKKNGWVQDFYGILPIKE